MPCVLLLTGTLSSASIVAALHCYHDICLAIVLYVIYQSAYCLVLRPTMRSVLQSSCMVCARVPTVSSAARVPNPGVFSLAQVVYEWARGTPFEEICELTDVMEGSIVRTIVRLDEVCREFRDAARVMGNTQLFQQMEQASAAIKRDVIFAASLYVS